VKPLHGEAYLGIPGGEGPDAKNVGLRENPAPEANRLPKEFGRETFGRTWEEGNGFEFVGFQGGEEPFGEKTGAAQPAQRKGGLKARESPGGGGGVWVFFFWGGGGFFFFFGFVV